MTNYRLKTARLTNQSLGNLIDNALGEVEAQVAGLLGITLDTDYTSAVVAAAVHTHAESSITGLVSDLAGKAAASHTHAEADVTSLVSDLAGKATPTDITTAVSNHAAASDPHAGYQKESEKNAANGYAGLDSGALTTCDIGLNPSLPNGTAQGIKEPVVAGETVVFGDSLYLKAADDRFWKTDADASATATSRIAMCLASGGAGDAIGVLDVGYIAKAGWSWTVGAPVYLSPTSGELTQTVPSSAGQFVRIVGYAKTATALYYKPDNCWVETAS